MNKQEEKNNQKVQLIMQTLQELGYQKSFDSLIKESRAQYESFQVQKLRELVLNDQLQDAIQLILELQLSQSEQIIILIMERQYMLLLKGGLTEKAVELLRSQFPLYSHNTDRFHQLATLMVSEEPLPILSPSELLSRIISLAYEELGTVQPKRLESLIIQQKIRQSLECNWHRGLDFDYSLKKTHLCPSVSFSRQVVKLEVHDDEVWICQFSPNGRYLASICKKNRLCVTEVEYQNDRMKIIPLFSEIVHGNSIQQVSFSPCSQLLATCSQDNTIKMFVITNEVKLVYHMKGHQDKVCGIGWNLIGENDIKQKKSFSIFSRKPQQIEIKDKWELITGSIDGWLYFWRNGERKCGQKLESITFLHSDQKGLIVEQAKHRKLSFLDINKSHILRFIEESDEIVSSNVSFDFEWLMVNVSYKDPRVNLYSVSKFQLLRQFRGYQQLKFCLKGSIGWFNNSLIALGSENGELLIWHRYNDKSPLERVKVSDKPINCVSFNRKHVELIAIASDDHILSLYTSSREKIIVDTDSIKLKQEDTIKSKVNHMFNQLIRYQPLTIEQESSQVQQSSVHIDEEEEQLQSEDDQEESQVMEPEDDEQDSN